jgi:hypothetical protein
LQQFSLFHTRCTQFNPAIAHFAFPAYIWTR